MDSEENGEDLNGLIESVELSDGDPSQHQEISAGDMLRIKQQIENQCLEMQVHLDAGKNKRSCSASEAERNISESMGELEELKTIQLNQTLALHRMQMWHAISEKLKLDDSEAASLRLENDRFMSICSQIKQVKKETKLLQDEITEMQKKRLEMKRLTHEKMKEMETLMSTKEYPNTEKYRAILEKGQSNLEKYKKMAVMTQNVLRGILLACKINWLDDTKLRDVAMMLEELPISD